MSTPDTRGEVAAATKDLARALGVPLDRLAPLVEPDWRTAGRSDSDRKTVLYAPYVARRLFEDAFDVLTGRRAAPRGES